MRNFSHETTQTAKIIHTSLLSSVFCKKQKPGAEFAENLKMLKNNTMLPFRF